MAKTNKQIVVVAKKPKVEAPAPKKEEAKKVSATKTVAKKSAPTPKKEAKAKVVAAPKKAPKVAPKVEEEKVTQLENPVQETMDLKYTQSASEEKVLIPQENLEITQTAPQDSEIITAPEDDIPAIKDEKKKKLSKA